MTQAALRESEFTLTDRDFREIVALVKRETAIVLGDHKRNLVYGRLARRLRALGLEDFSDYVDYLKGPEGPSELREMMNAVTTNLTSFFREPHHFETLERDVLPGWVKAQGQSGGRLRIWSAGCSSGEEPYSIAMTLAQCLPRGRAHDAKILATDIDTQMVATASAGLYAEDRVKGIPDRYMRAFVREAGDGRLEMADTLKALITFKPLNLFDAWPMRGPFDVIFCRNVMIYFDKAGQAELFEKFAQIMAPGGTLFIGHSETLPAGNKHFTHAGRTTYRRQS